MSDIKEEVIEKVKETLTEYGYAISYDGTVGNIGDVIGVGIVASKNVIEAVKEGVGVITDNMEANERERIADIAEQAVKDLIENPDPEKTLDECFENAEEEISEDNTSETNETENESVNEVNNEEENQGNNTEDSGSKNETENEENESESGTETENDNDEVNEDESESQNEKDNSEENPDENGNNNNGTDNDM